MRIRAFVSFTLLFVLSSSEAFAQRRPIVPAPVVISLPPGAATRPVSFTRMVIKMNRGQVFGTENVGVACIPRGKLTWRGGKMDVSGEELDVVFREEIEAAGFTIDGDPDNLFEKTTNSGEYAVAGNMSNVQVKVCTPFNGFGNISWKGQASMSVEWQIYSRLESKVVAKILTTGAFEQTSLSDDSTILLYENAFGENVQKLIASNEFRSIFVGDAKPSSEKVTARAQEVLSISSITPAAAAPLSDAIGSVVAIFSGDGHGSGFLISSDGYMLTNHHVVGATKFVKVRWSDGFETLGEVIRFDKGRDVALIKTDPRGRQPLVLRLNGVQPGENVIAIGTPIDPQYQNSVTKGVSSGNRVKGDGFSYLQSDVSVNPGNSGGPLLDEQSRVVAITAHKDTRGENLNFFIPVRDAMDFLAVKIQ